MTDQLDNTSQESQESDPIIGYIQFLNFHFALICPHCKERVLDPDKKKNQLHIKNKCPSCGKDPKDYKNPNKKPRKLSKKEKRHLQQQKDAAARGKY